MILQGLSLQHKLETKASSHEGQCIPAGSSVSPPKRVLTTVTRMHGSAIRCVRSDSRSIWNMANLTPL